MCVHADWSITVLLQRFPFIVRPVKCECVDIIKRPVVLALTSILFDFSTRVIATLGFTKQIDQCARWGPGTATHSGSEWVLSLCLVVEPRYPTPIMSSSIAGHPLWRSSSRTLRQHNCAFCFVHELDQTLKYAMVVRYTSVTLLMWPQF